MNILISNSRVVDPANRTDAVQNVYVAEADRRPRPAPDGFVAERTIDAGGLVVAPAFIDLAARLREPGNTSTAPRSNPKWRRRWPAASPAWRSARHRPVLDEAGLVEMLTYRAKKLNRAHIYPVGALTIGLQGERLSGWPNWSRAGCVAFSQANVPILVDNTVLMRALQYAATFGFRVWLQPLAFLSPVGTPTTARWPQRLGLSASRSPPKPSLYTYRARAHHRPACTSPACPRPPASRSSTRRAQRHGRDLRRVDQPYAPVRHGHRLASTPTATSSAAAQPARPRGPRPGLAEGRIDALCSDHTPVDDDAKQTPFSESNPAATGLELLLPLTLKWADRAGLALLDGLAASPRTRRRSSASPRPPPLGGRAPTCACSTRDPRHHHPRGASGARARTPFLGMELPGRVRYTLVEGG